jgi:hypothetical protein
MLPAVVRLAADRLQDSVAVLAPVVSAVVDAWLDHPSRLADAHPVHAVAGRC